MSALDLSISYWWLGCPQRADNVLGASGQAASMDTTGGTESWWKKGGFGAEWGNMARVQSLRNSHWVFQRMALGRAEVKSGQKQSVWPQASDRS